MTALGVWVAVSATLVGLCWVLYEGYRWLQRRLRWW